MKTAEFKKLDGLDLSNLLAQRQTTPYELMQTSIELATKLDQEFDFLCHEQFDESLALAQNWEERGAFRGIPFLLKDSGLASRRFPSHVGSALFKDSKYAVDSFLAERFEKAGFIAYARTTVPELCMAPTTEATVYGKVTKNPWDVTRSPGGSSGGAAVAVATGVVPVAHGSDGGGSIRIPAACCGIYGFKASRGVVPMGPLRGEGWGGLAVDGVLSRTVRDTAAAMDAIGGYAPGSPYAAPVFERSFMDAVQPKAFRKLRIGVWRETFGGVTTDPEVSAALEKTVQICKDLGHEIVDLNIPEFDYQSYIKAHTNVLAGNIVNSVEAKLQASGQTLSTSDLERAIYTGYEYGKTLSARDYIEAVNTFHAVGRLMSGWMQSIDILMTPALCKLPAKLGELSMDRDFWDLRKRVGNYSCFMAIINASGQPAAALPTYWTGEGLPVATQIIGHFGQDDVVLQLSAEIESTKHWRPFHYEYQV
ncbi:MULTISPECIES: amidase [unclassified Bordetella]|uniref:amidase n=1 Tax=unclassified Bordetella TaxID=2630031 RepID=UPI00132456FE|nr:MULTISPECIES: amidase [unclassified Bordetella]MVW72965.1 amidase [Bordetella sp. 15P40C-2]MVW79052.1 amidase [Bordetella sp. 02P26C-1]